MKTITVYFQIPFTIDLEDIEDEIEYDNVTSVMSDEERREWAIKEAEDSLANSYEHKDLIDMMTAADVYDEEGNNL